MVDDPNVRLVRDVDVDVVDGLAAFGQNLLRRADEHAGGELEHLASVHLDEVLPLRDGLRARRRPRPSGGQVELRPARAVRAELEAEKTAFGDAVENDRPGAVSEQDGGAAIAPVEDPGEHVAADDERVARKARGEHPVPLGDRVHEARAAGGEVIGAGFVGT